MEFVVGTLLAIVGILITIIIFLYQERSPKVEIECFTVPDGNPSIIKCEVHNKSKKVAEDVYVGFRNLLPLDTKVFASPETVVDMIESERPPDPIQNPHTAKLTKAFTIYIPRVAPKDKIVITIQTVNPDNQRAAEQVLRIRKEIQIILEAFGERLLNTTPKEAKKWDLQAVINARVKEENFFVPGKFLYSEGRFPVNFFSEDEEQAKAINQDLYARYKRKFIDIYQNRQEFKAPVVRIKTEEGERTYAIMPPYVKSFVEVQVPVDQIKKHGEVLIYPPIPEKYI